MRRIGLMGAGLLPEGSTHTEAQDEFRRFKVAQAATVRIRCPSALYADAGNGSGVRLPSLRLSTCLAQSCGRSAGAAGSARPRAGAPGSAGTAAEALEGGARAGEDVVGPCRLCGLGQADHVPPLDRAPP